MMKPLCATSRLFEAFHSHGISYCHWKSNEHLLAGLAGETDLDLLVDRRHYAEASALFAECGFRRFDATEKMRYPAIEDHLALDAETGRLIHCHVHYRLVAGEPHLKGHRIPWESICLSTRRFDEEHGVYVADPNLELLLLLVRYSLKLRTRDQLLRLARRRFPGRAFDVEYRWLLERAELEVTMELCRTLLGPTAVPAYEALLRGPVTARSLGRFRRAAASAFARFRSYGPASARLRRWAREIAWISAGLNRRYLGLRRARPSRRTSPTGGLLIAVIGSDGSGKSTLTRSLATSLGTKIDVCRVYFGSGDGPTSLLRWPLKLARSAAVAVGLLNAHGGLTTQKHASEWPTPQDENGRNPAARRERPALIGAARVVWALVLSAEKRARLKRAWIARDLGMVVIADRYPQAQFTGFNDGPLLANLAQSSNGLLRRLAEWEARPYVWADEHPPDLVLRLDVSPEVAEQRKPETGTEEIVRRVRAVRALRYGHGAVVFNVDADRPAAEVMCAARSAVWQNL